MPADVDERVQLARCVSGGEHGDPARVGREEGAGRRDLLGATRVLPRAREDVSALAAELLLVGVPREREGDVLVAQELAA